MKIGILSLKYYNNYGGILQSLALQEATKLIYKNAEVEIINYKPTYKESLLHIFVYKLFDFIFSPNKIAKITDRKREINKIKGIDSSSLLKNNEEFMIKYLNRGELISEKQISEYCKKFDTIIIGSDQVWSVTNHSKLIYFFDWTFNGKKIGYSVCSVYEEPSFLNRLKIKHLINKFNALSVRDITTQKFVYNTNKFYPPITVDPTLLVDFDYLINHKLNKNNYILMYILGDEISGGNSEAINKIRKYIKTDLEVKSIIIPSCSEAGKIAADQIYDNCTPSEWLNLIYNADFVFTDSFHGCIFSIKYNKKFIGYYKYIKRSTRLLDLKSRYNLMNIISSTSELEEALKNSNNIIKPLLEKDIQKSFNYLKDNLK